MPEECNITLFPTDTSKEHGKVYGPMCLDGATRILIPLMSEDKDDIMSKEHRVISQELQDFMCAYLAEHSQSAFDFKTGLVLMGTRSPTPLAEDIVAEFFVGYDHNNETRVYRVEIIFEGNKTILRSMNASPVMGKPSVVHDPILVLLSSAFAMYYRCRALPELASNLNANERYQSRADIDLPFEGPSTVKVGVVMCAKDGFQASIEATATGYIITTGEQIHLAYTTGEARNVITQCS